MLMKLILIQTITYIIIIYSIRYKIKHTNMVCQCPQCKIRPPEYIFSSTHPFYINIFFFINSEYLPIQKKIIIQFKTSPLVMILDF